MRVEKVIKELTEKDYDRELLDDTDRNEDGKRRYEINCMYEVKLQNGEIINAYEDELTQIVAIMKHDEVIISEREKLCEKKMCEKSILQKKIFASLIKISVEDNVIAAECTLLFDVDKYFGTTTKKDNTWISFDGR